MTLRAWRGGGGVDLNVSKILFRLEMLACIIDGHACIIEMNKREITLGLHCSIADRRISNQKYT